jgi:DNA-binding CsgD family transcriptional regulator/tetratricopeptide (TPR) repeat protein
MQLLERDLFLEDLDRLLSQAASGQGHLVFIAGEAGVGKSSLVDEFCRRVFDTARCLRGSCDPLSTPRPLGPLFDIAAQVGGDLEVLVRDASERYEIFTACLELLRAGSKPNLAVIEDVHWADEATLDLLRYTGRRIDTIPAMVLATFRDDEVGPRHPLRTVLGDLATSPAIQRMGIPPLSRKAVGQLAGESGIDAGRLHDLTGGNPFYVTEVLASGTSGIPETVRDAVLARADRLPYTARQMLDIAAVIGFSSEAWLLESVAASDFDAVDACVATGVLRYLPDGSGFVFRHEIARQAILAAMPPHQRIRLNRTVMLAIQSSDPGPDLLARMAHHAEEAGDRQAVLRYAPAAAERAASLNSHREARAQYSRALRFAEGEPPETRAELLDAYAAECQIIDRPDETIEACREMVEIWTRLGQPLRVGEYLTRMAGALVVSGRNQEAEQASRESIELLELHGPSVALARAYRGQAHLRMLNRDAEDAIEIGVRAITLADQIGDNLTVIESNNTVGAAMMVAGDFDGERYLLRSLEMGQESGLENAVAAAYSNLGSGFGEMYQFDKAVRYLLEGIAFSSERDLDYQRWYMVCWLSLCYLHQGRWPEAADVATSVTRRRNVAAISRIMALLALGRLRARRGDPDVWDALDEAVDMAVQTATLQRIGPVRAARAEAAWLAGDLERTGEEARAVYDLALQHQHRWHTGELTYWRWKSGETVPVPDCVAEPYRLQVAGEWQAASDAWRALGCPYEAARALADSDDEALLRRALQELEALGAAPLAGIVTRKLRDLGVRGIPRGPRADTLASPAGLTRRETEVLILVAEGLRDADIAERLYLSPKTVGHHVSSILGKLGVHSRTEAAGEAVRLGITSPK